MWQCIFILLFAKGFKEGKQKWEQSNDERQVTWKSIQLG